MSSRYLNTIGKTSVAVAICDRCHLKMPAADMVQDKNAPGIRGHDACMDRFDPWRLPARRTEDVRVRNVRFDADISVTANASQLPIPDGEPS